MFRVWIFSLAVLTLVISQELQESSQEPQSQQDEALPAKEELERLRSFLLQDRSLQLITLSPDVGRLLQRCWTAVWNLDIDVDIQWRSRFVLLLIRSLNLGDWVVQGSCQRWATLALPDQVLHYMDPEIAERMMSGSSKQERHELERHELERHELPLRMSLPAGPWDLWVVGAHSSGPSEVQHILDAKPARIHFFEPIQAFYQELQLQWRDFDKNVHLEFHNFGLGLAREEGRVFMAARGTSLFHPMEFSGNRLFVDSVSDPAVGRVRDQAALIRVNASDEVWKKLGMESLGLLYMNCEGCEFEVIPQLAAAGLLGKIRVLFVAVHLILNKEEAEQFCDAEGTCQRDAAFFGVHRYCDFFEAYLSETHVRVWGLPFAFQHWVLKDAHSQGI